jgi:RHS repeat-associated protein
VDNLLSADPYANRFLYTGREFLKEANLYDYRNRVYSPDLGRFLQTDPIRFDAGDVNLYRYVFNLPILLNDPTGEIAPVAIYIGAKAIKGGIAGAVGGYTSALAGQAQSGNFDKGGLARGAAAGFVAGAVVGALDPNPGVTGGIPEAAAGAGVQKLLELALEGWGSDSKGSSGRRGRRPNPSPPAPGPPPPEPPPVDPHTPSINPPYLPMLPDNPCPYYGPDGQIV